MGRTAAVLTPLADGPGAAEALIEEARRRRRRRRLRLLIAVIVAVAALVFAFVLVTPRTHAWSPVVGPTIPRVSPVPSAPGVFPERPAALVVGPNGHLFVADDGRNEILERQDDGRFRVVAGSGVAGFGGDDSDATQARLNYPAGMAFARDGTLYFADQQNDRVRAVSPSGMISTIAGGGSIGPSVATGTNALQAGFEPHDVKFGPGNALYIVTSDQVLRLERDRTLTHVAGSANAGVAAVGGPAVNASTDGANAIAFDRTGGFYLAGSGPKTLLYVTPNRTLTKPYADTSFYPRGNAGIATAADGSVVAIDSQSVVRLTKHGMKSIVTFLNPNVLRQVKNFQPNGIAIGPDRTIYVDTWNGNGYTDTNAIVAINPRDSSPSLLWSHH